MAEGSNTSRYYGVQVRSKKNGQKSYEAYFYTAPSWPTVVHERCQNKKKIPLGTVKTEEEAASAADQ